MLENHPVLTAKQLSEHFEVSVRTIYRDLEVLSEAGYSIVTESGKGGGIRLLNSKRLRLSAMDESEILHIAQQFSFSDARNPLAQNVALKIRSQLPEEAQRVFDTLEKHNLVDDTTWQGRSADTTQVMEILQKAIVDRRKISVSYLSGNEVCHGRILHPVGIVKKAQYFYLVAFCEMRHAYRTFSVYKLHNIVVTEHVFDEDVTFNLKDYWSETSKAYQSKYATTATRGDTGINVKYRVEIERSAAAEQLTQAFNQLLSDGDSVIAFDGISESIVFPLLFARADEIKVLKPQALADRIILKAQQIIIKHSTFH